MKADPSQVPQQILLEVLYFAGGIRSKLYGSHARPDWVPPSEQIGLQNDVYLAPGQFALDFSRFRYADDVAREGAAHWLGVYGHAKDLYGDRGNFCGVGLWVQGICLPDTENLYDMLLKLVSALQKAGLKDDGLSTAFDDVATRAIDFAVTPANWLGAAKSCLTPDFGSSYGARATYVVLDESPMPGARLPVDLGLAVDALFVSQPQDVPARVLFLPSSEINFDSRVGADRIVKGVNALFGEPPRSIFVRSLLSASSSMSDQLDHTRTALIHATENIGRLEIELLHTKAATERPAESFVEAPGSSSLPAVSSDEFFDRLADVLQRQLKDIGKDVPTPREQYGLGFEGEPSRVASDLTLIKKDLRLLVDNMIGPGSNIPRSWSQPPGPEMTAPHSFSPEFPPVWLWVAGAVGLLTIGAGIYDFLLR